LFFSEKHLFDSPQSGTAAFRRRPAEREGVFQKKFPGGLRPPDFNFDYKITFITSM
jgi:hypothetical protein